MGHGEEAEGIEAYFHVVNLFGGPRVQSGPDLPTLPYTYLSLLYVQ